MKAWMEWKNIKKMAPHQRTPMGNPYYKPYSTWVFMGKLSPRIPREHNKYHGCTVKGTPNCPLILGISS